MNASIRDVDYKMKIGKSIQQCKTKEKVIRNWTTKMLNSKMYKTLTMCNCNGSSEQIRPSGDDLTNPHSTSSTGDDAGGIKSCTSARTGGGDGCLMISDCRGLSSVSKEINEAGSSRRSTGLSLSTGNIDSRHGFPHSELTSSFLSKDSFSRGCRSLFSLQGLRKYTQNSNVSTLAG